MREHLVVAVIASLMCSCLGVCPLPFVCITNSPILTQLYSRVAAGTFHITDDEFEILCSDWPAIKLCLDTSTAGCAAREKPNLLLLSQYIDYTCGSGKTVFQQKNNCVGQAVLRFKMPSECTEALNTTEHTLIEYMFSLIGKSSHEEVCRLMITYRECAIAPMERMCGTEAGGYWREANNNAIVYMYASKDPDCDHFVVPTTQEPTTASNQVSGAAEHHLSQINILLLLITIFVSCYV